MEIGIIGLGAMGFPIACNLVRSGIAVKGYDLSEHQRQLFADAGGMAQDTIRSTVKDSDVVLMSLPNPQIVTDVMLSEKGVLNSCKPGCCVLDMSSVDPETTRRICRCAEERDVLYGDAPVSGGVSGAEAGTLTIMFGGSKELWDKVQPILNVIGKRLFYVGGAGSGDAIKIVNNLLLGCNMAAVSEAVNLGEKLGLSTEIIKEIVGNSSGNSYAFSAKMEKFIIPEKYEGGFSTDLQYKDLRLALDAGTGVRTPLPMTAVAAQVFEASRSMGNGKKDISSAVTLWKKLEE